MQRQHASRQSAAHRRQRVTVRPHAQAHLTARQINGWQRVLSKRAVFLQPARTDLDRKDLCGQYFFDLS
jgi:hypothetical protein